MWELPQKNTENNRIENSGERCTHSICRYRRHRCRQAIRYHTHTLNIVHLLNCVHNHGLGHWSTIKFNYAYQFRMVDPCSALALCLCSFRCEYRISSVDDQVSIIIIPIRMTRTLLCVAVDEWWTMTNDVNTRHQMFGYAPTTTIL